MKKQSPVIIAMGFLFLSSGCASRRSTGVEADAMADTAIDDQGPPPDQNRPDQNLSTPDVRQFQSGVCPDPTAGLPPCGSKCGNALLDSCEQCESAAGAGGAGAGAGESADAAMPPPMDWGPQCTTISEQCDGKNLADATCKSLGYAGGTLACGTDCRFDTSGCSGCATHDKIAACLHPSVGEQWPAAFDIASTPTEIAVAWASGDYLTSTLNFAVFDAALEPLGQSLCFADDVLSLSIARVEDSWMIAAANNERVVIYLISNDDISEVQTIAGARNPELIERPKGGPLLTFVDDENGLSAALLDAADGSVAWRTQVLDRTYAAGTTGVFTGTGFLVADRRTTYYTDEGGVRVVRVDLSGKVTSSSAPGSSSTEYPSITWHGDHARLVWSDFGAQRKMFTAKLDAQGNRVGAAIELPFGYDYFNWAATAARNDELLALFAGYTGWTGHGSHLAFARLEPDGTAKATKLTQFPATASNHRLVRLGDRTVAAWIQHSEPPSLGLALLDL